MKALMAWLDRWQSSHKVPAFIVAVIKRHGDDRGGPLAAVVAFYGFLSILPLTLLATTILGFVLGGDPSLRQSIENSITSQFPAIGQVLVNKSLHGSLAAIAFGAVGLAWGGLGAGRAIEFAVLEVWHVPRAERPRFTARVIRALGIYALIGLAIILSTGLASLGVWLGAGLVGSALAAVGALVVTIGVFGAIYRLLGPEDMTFGQHLPGAVVGGVGWQALQLGGQALVRHNLRHTSALYGEFAIVLGVLSVMSIAANLFVYSAEINVVRYEHDWPRSLVRAT